MDSILYNIKRFIPNTLLQKVRPLYHLLLSYAGAVWYRHPSQYLTVVAVTGTKGKSTVTEMTAHLLRTHGFKVASLSTIRFMIDEEETPNLFKMTTPGRFFVQRFLRQAVDDGCTHVVLEMTSEGAKQFRHRFIEFDALIFTNLSPEHIESHGSFENYKNAKLRIAGAVFRSKKRPRFLIANTDNEHGVDFLNFEVEHKIGYSLKDISLYTLQKESVTMVIENTTIRVPLVGLFNVYNALAATTLAQALGITLATIERAFRTLPPVHGRVEQFHSDKDKKAVTAVVDYAHTPDSLKQFYEAFPNVPKVCILGNTGGGRDTWKRPEMGGIAARHCDQVILTNEDPYDENPRKIVEDMAKGIDNKSKLTIIMDRREAIRTALKMAPEGGYVLISGKGTDPYIMGPNNTRQVWSDAEVVKEELARL
ncbi:MAG: UDP-N-acetylmuramyl-tripeptide synthetase [Candidatus Pacebacteria bacterium]|nr:UDP-N-acetylmuramyl-tripeptide synthetase [Candidatus Paceibacterota bacterium]